MLAMLAALSVVTICAIGIDVADAIGSDALSWHTAGRIIHRDIGLDSAPTAAATRHRARTQLRRPALFAAGAPLGTFRHQSRVPRRPTLRSEARWSKMLAADLVELSEPAGLESLLVPARRRAHAVATSPMRAPGSVGSTITVAGISADDLRARRSTQPGPAARSRELRGDETEREAVLDDIAEVMGLERDFAAELRGDDRLFVAFESIDPVEEEQAAEKRLAAWSLIRDDGRTDAYWFAPKNGGEPGYYDRSGRAVGTMLVPAPCEHERISSRFVAKRLHPVHRVHRPHSGIDYAAVRGTPVHAVADGVVELVATNAESGNFLRVRHDTSLMSHYAHLERFAEGIVKGKSVRRGDLIGYVGSTGAASGPHLHLGISIDGRFVDPEKVRLPRTGALAGADLDAFGLQLARIDGAYAQAGLTAPTRQAVAMAAEASHAAGRN